jgi:PAS domain S-box-containing protein
VAVEALKLGVADYILKDSTGSYLNLLPLVVRQVLEQRRLLQGKQRAELELTRSEERYRSLVETSGDCVWEVDPQGKCTYVSPKVEAVLGYQPAEILGVKLFDLLQPAEARRVLRLVAGHLRKRDPIRNLQTVHRHKQGRRVILETGAIPIFGSDGTFRGYRGIDRDITDRKMAEESLRMSEQKFRAAVDYIAVGITVINRSMEITFLNRQMQEWFPTIDPAQCTLCYRAFRDPPRETVCDRCPTAMTFADGEVHEAVQEVVYGGETKHFRIVSSPIRDERAEVVAVIELVDDVTERLRSEKSLQESERLLRRVLDANPTLIFAKDRDGRYLLANQAMAALYDTTPDKLIGRTDHDFARRGCITPETAEKFCHDDALVIDRQQAVQIPEERVEMPDGTIRWFQTTKSPLTIATGHPCVLGVAADITERKRMEQNLTQAQKLEAVGQLAAGIAHEINTPIQYIGDNTRFVLEAFQGFGELLPVLERLIEACKSGTAGEALVGEAEEAIRQSDIVYFADEVPRAAQQSLEGVDRVARIVRAIKEFAHPGTEEKHAIDLNRAVDNTLTLARNEWKYVADVTTEFDPELPPVFCLPSDINQVVLNLVVNAAQAIGERLGDSPDRKGTITVATRRDGPWAEISVRDTGNGIPEEIHSKIFNPFFTTKEVGRGTGQGLSIAHSLVVEKHSGTIEFQTELGVGTTFLVRLPIDGRPAACCVERAETPEVT